jgi:predicted peroxiredoxin
MKDLQKLIDKLIDNAVVGCDTYKHNSSTWLIFTNDKKWVIELTKEGTLWYNYYFFQKLFKVIALDVVENQHYITKWVEDNVINGVKSTKGEYYKEIQKVEYTIENGVKYTIDIEDAIENGVKCTIPQNNKSQEYVENTIQNGVKHTEKSLQIDGSCVIEETIQNGVKHTQGSIFDNPTTVKDTIQNGVKVTYSDKIPHEYDWSNQFTEEIDDIIKNGVKETSPGGYLGFVENKGRKIHQFETAKQLYYVEDVIESGIKKTEGAMLFDESQIDTVISDGIKETHDDVMPHTGRVEGVIKNGVKQCIPSHIPLYNPMDFSVEYRENHRLDDVASVLEKGIKEVQPLPSQEGNMDWGIYYHRQEVPTKPHTQYVDDVITNGIKETKPMDEWVNTERIVDGVICGGSLIR